MQLHYTQNIGVMFIQYSFEKKKSGNRDFFGVKNINID